MRRETLKQHTLPRNFSIRYHQLDEIIRSQAKILIANIRAKRTSPDAAIDIKPIFVENCANLFCRYFFSRSFSAYDVEFQRLMANFDFVFHEMNTGYAMDFLPFLLNFNRSYLRKMEICSEEIREFMVSRIIQDRPEKWTENDDSSQFDYVDALIDHIKRGYEPKIEWETAYFALEDLMGGHAAAGCFLARILGYIADLPDVQKKIHQEIDNVFEAKRNSMDDIIELTDRHQMPYTEAVCMEALRLIISPLFPRVASQDCSIGPYFVKEGTLVLFNNYDLCMSTEYWDEPTAFKPERFIQDGRMVKPAHFLPFGAGRRGCLGYKIIQTVSFSLLANCMKDFELRRPDNVTNKVDIGLLPIPDKSIHIIFTDRVKKQ